ncbi:hypothetical protein D3C81_1593880 [compost metagenome]
MHSEQQANEDGERATDQGAVQFPEQGKHGRRGFFLGRQQNRAALEGGLFLNLLGACHCFLELLAFGLLALERGATEDGHPQDGDQGRHHQSTDDELANGPPLGNPRDEQPHEWPPGHPPWPIEGGPPVLPLGVFLRVHPQAQTDQVLDIVPGGFEHEVKDVTGRPDHQDNQHQQDRHVHVECRNPFHSLGQACQE